MRPALLVLLFLSGTTAADAQQIDSPRRVDFELEVPLSPCAVPSATQRLARAMHLSVGLEIAEGDCATRPPVEPNVPSLRLTDLSLDEAFEELQRLDPRYSWSTAYGMRVVRILQQQDDPSAMLNLAVGPLSLESGTIRDALFAVKRLMQTGEAVVAQNGPEWAALSPDLSHRFSVNVGRMPLIDVLNAIVHAHGALRWQVYHCASDRAQLRFETLDMAGVATTLTLNDTRPDAWCGELEVFRAECLRSGASADTARQGVHLLPDPRDAVGR
jgi:hypothetical protein